MRSKFCGRLFTVTTLLLVLSAPLHAQGEGKFVLNCAGTLERPRAQTVDFIRSYYVDPASGTFCFDSCTRSYALAGSDEDIIDLSWRNPSDGTVTTAYSGGATTYSRNSGEFRSSEVFSGATLYRFQLEGHCETKPLYLLPMLDFLARGPDE
jgi:hypothetical protein